MRSLLAAAVVLLGLSSCIPPFAPPSHGRLAADLASKTVALVAEDEDGNQHVVCSGVWVGKNQILTANHCVDDKEVGDGVEYAVLGDVVELPVTEKIFSRIAVLTDTDENHDLALLYVPNVGLLEHGIAQIATHDIDVGDPVVTMGNPLGMVWSFSSGEVTAIRFLNGDDDHPGLWYVQADAPISPGNSGGGLYDDRGRLIGITRMYAPRGELLNFFVHRDYILAFLKAS